MITSNINSFLNDTYKFNSVVQESKEALTYPVLDVKREKYITDLSEYYGNWTRGWTDDPKWLNYGLIYDYKTIPIAEKRHPETFKFLNNFGLPIFMAGFSLLKSKGNIPIHRDEELAREFENIIHIGLDVPDNCILQVENILFKHETRKYLTFSDHKYHSVYNNSNDNRLLLYIKIG